MEAGERKEREARESVFLSATLVRFGHPAPTKHRVRNLSTRGACVDGARALRRGETLLIHVGLLEEVAATVMWIEHDLAGVKFAHPIAIENAKTRPKPAHIANGWSGVAVR